MCNVHYQRWYRSGATDRQSQWGMSIADRLAARSELQPNGCVEWVGPRNRGGYGRISYQDKTVTTHRLAYVLAHGPLDEGLLVRHKCDNPPCINPDHLESGTVKDNYDDMAERRGADHLKLGGPASGAVKRGETTCKRGHAFDEANTYWRNGRRCCKTCKYEAWKRWYERQKRD